MQYYTLPLIIIVSVGGQSFAGQSFGGESLGLVGTCEQPATTVRDIATKTVQA